MIKLNLTATTPEEKTVLEHLIPQASETLAEKINNGVYIEKDGKRLLNKKDLATFMQYATEQAKKTIDEKQRKGAQTVCVHGNDIMSWAIHYFEEDSIEGKLYNEDGTEYNPPKTVKQTAKPTPTSTTPSISTTIPKPQPKPQLNIFDMLSASTEPKPKTLTAPVAVEQPAPKPEPKKGSEMYQHYRALEQKYPECIIAYRLGDFYEVFGDNAVKLSDDLDLTLTGRDMGLDSRVPMVGFPYHKIEEYVRKIVQHDHKIAVVDGADDIRCYTNQYSNPVNLITGEIISDEPEELSVEEMQKFDGDLDEPEELPTVSTVVGDCDDDDFDYEKERQAIQAFDVEAMIILQELLDNKITLL